MTADQIERKLSELRMMLNDVKGLERERIRNAIIVLEIAKA